MRFSRQIFRWYIVKSGRRLLGVQMGILLILALLAQTGCAAQADTGVGATAEEAAPDPTGGNNALDLSELGFNEGSPDAPLKIIEFSDFGCHYCREFHNEVYHHLEEEYIQTGKVAWKYVPFILGIFPNASEAATAGMCAAEQGKFATLRDRLFIEQSEWKSSSDPLPLLYEYARQEGLDMDDFGQCVTEARPADDIRFNTQLAMQLGIRGTPTFFILGEGTIPGSIPLETFRAVLDQTLAKYGH